MIETAPDRPLRILHVHADEDAPGGDSRTLALMEGLAEFGHRQTLLAHPGSSLFADASARGLDVQPLTLPAIVRLSRELDLVHAHDSRSHSMAAATTRVPLIATRHIAPRIRRGPGFRWKFRRTAHFIAVSHDVEKLLLDAAIPLERISVVDAEREEMVRETLAVYRRVLEPPPQEASSSS
jgi:hypothetical protein